MLAASTPCRPLGWIVAVAALLAHLLQDTTADDERGALFAETFDTHWERLRDDYPYFGLYGVDWEAERAEHRPAALAAADGAAFAHEMARMLACLPDAHLAYMPPPELFADWSLPEVRTKLVERRPLVIGWDAAPALAVPPAFADDEHVYPEIVAVEGVTPVSATQFLAPGPRGSTLHLRLRWPDGSESEQPVLRPVDAELPPLRTHYGSDWLVVGRVDDIGYMRVRSFSPSLATLGPDGKMTTMLRAALRELDDTRGLILDFQGNGGGMVAASDPFLGNLVERSLSYRWGRADGKRRRIVPRRPRYDGEVVVLVDERSASGGEWAARILRDAGRAVVVGGRTQGAEAAVHESHGPDGSVIHFSAWPMEEPGRTPFQEVGVQRDHPIDLTVADVRALGYDVAVERVRRTRLAQALALLDGPADGVDTLMDLFMRGETAGQQPDGAERDEVVTRAPADR